jgi:DNA-binding NarL/FixJ family response regulator
MKSTRLRVQVIERPLVGSASLARGLGLRFALVTARAEVAVLDLNSLGEPADELIRRLRQGGAKVLVLSSSAERAVVAMAIRAGADGFLVQLADFDALAQAIEALAAGRNVYGPEVAVAFADPDADPEVDLQVVDGTEWDLEPARSDEADDMPLSPRETQILRLVATGHSSQAIARSLAISVPTVRKHRENLMRKLGLHNVAEVTAFALRRDLLASSGAPGVT